MTLTSVASLVDLLQETGLLTPPQLAAAADLEAQCQDARAAAEMLLARQWLTPYQLDQLFSDQPKQNLILGPYILMERLGEGGMGQVFKARHHLLQRVVALKLIHEERLNREPEAIQRFEREARAAALLSHPHIVMIYDAGRAGQAYYIAMEYIDGIDLGRLVRKEGPLPVAQACEYIRHAALGLEHAHAQGMVHRDIKPSNLLLARGSGLVKILDMGLARFERGEDSTSASLTREGVIIGTPDYIAPEQARNARKVDVRSDLYSLGATSYFLLTGRPPFPDGTTIEKLLMHQLDEPTSIHKLRPAVPPHVVAVVHKLLAKAPRDRYQTPTDLIADLTALQGRFTPPAAHPAADTTSPAAGLTRKMPLPARPAPAAEAASETVAQAADSDLTASGSPALRREAGQKAKHLARLPGHLGAVVGLAFNANRDTLASGGFDGTLRIWDFSKGVSERAVLRKHSGPVASVAFAPDESLVAAGSGSTDGEIYLGDLGRRQPHDLAALAGHAGPVFCLAFSPVGHLLASGGQDMSIRVWDVGGRPRSRALLKGHTSAVRALAFSPDGQLLASAAQDGSIRLWEIGRLWSRERAVIPHAGGACSVAFSADGELLIAGGQARLVRLWDLKVNPPTLDSELAEHDGPIRQVLATPDGERLIAVGEGERLTVWQRDSDRVQEWLLPRLSHSAFALTIDGRYLANGGIDGVINVYRVGEKRSSHHGKARPEEQV